MGAAFLLFLAGVWARLRGCVQRFDRWPQAKPHSQPRRPPSRSLPPTRMAKDKKAAAAKAGPSAARPSPDQQQPGPDKDHLKRARDLLQQVRVEASGAKKKGSAVNEVEKWYTTPNLVGREATLARLLKARVCWEDAQRKKGSDKVEAITSMRNALQHLAVHYKRGPERSMSAMGLHLWSLYKEALESGTFGMVVGYYEAHMQIIFEQSFNSDDWVDPLEEALHPNIKDTTDKLDAAAVAACEYATKEARLKSWWKWCKNVYTKAKQKVDAEIGAQVQRGQWADGGRGRGVAPGRTWRQQVGAGTPDLLGDRWKCHMTTLVPLTCSRHSCMHCAGRLLRCISRPRTVLPPCPTDPGPSPHSGCPLAPHAHGLPHPVGRPG